MEIVQNHAMETEPSSNPIHDDREHDDREPQHQTPGVLFLCVHNAGRSQMAAAFLRHLGGEGVRVYSAGSEPADRLNPAARDAMAERDIDISSAEPRRWTTEMLSEVDVVVTMGCGDECPVVPGTRYLDWALDDPAGLGVEAVRPIRDQIERRVRSLMAELDIAAP